MKKATISVAVEQEKLRAIQFYMGKSGTSLEAELDDFMARLYKKYVPSQTREYIESRESSEEPARPKKICAFPDQGVHRKPGEFRGASPSQVWQTRPHD